MAEFSKEYAEITGFSYYDFSYAEIFKELENDYYMTQICEGLGTYGVLKENNMCYLIVTEEGDIAEYTTFLSAYKLACNEKAKNHGRYKGN